ncbi:MAG TPA: class I SAM-dependent methyltransferase [Methanoregula sp.]|nr:class I SAM-dependent methyltransferase [Methanoregula sp.]
MNTNDMKRESRESGKSCRPQGHLCQFSPFRAWMLDNGIRRFFQNPKRITGPYVKEGMTAIDIGSGAGMFTIPIAEMVGDSGKVIAVDVQQEMLDLVAKKSEQRGMGSRIRIHRNGPDSIGLDEKADFVLSFYMLHEVPDRDTFLQEVCGLMKPGGKYLVVEPAFHLPESAFEDSVGRAERAGFRLAGNPKIFLSRAALFVRA